MKPEKITKVQDGLKVPDNPIIPFIEGDGIGPDIWAAAVRVFDAAVEKAYNELMTVCSFFAIINYHPYIEFIFCSEIH